MDNQAKGLEDVRDGLNKIAGEIGSVGNMYIWDKVCETDPEVTKEIKLGERKITSICAQSQRKRATELWGPYGQLWGVKNQKFTIIDVQLSNESKICLYEAILYYPGGEFPICSDIELTKEKEIWMGGQATGKYKSAYHEDWSKKAMTDALTKGLSFLGFNSDVFEGKFDDNKYVSDLKKEKKEEPKTNVEKVETVFNPRKQDDILWLYYELVSEPELKKNINKHLNDSVSDKMKNALIKMLDSKFPDKNYGDTA